VAGASFNLYFVRSFGIEGHYRHFFPNSENGVSSSGDREEIGAFIDFRFVRVFADYFREQETALRAVSREGVTLGTKVFF
jgi:hypothetical protein